MRTARTTRVANLSTPARLKFYENNTTGHWLVSGLGIDAKYIERAIKELNEKTLFTKLHEGINSLREMSKEIAQSGYEWESSRINEMIDELLLTLVKKLSCDVAESQGFTDDPLQTVIGPDYLEKIKNLKDKHWFNSTGYLSIYRNDLITRAESASGSRRLFDTIDSTIARLAILYHLKTRA